jgi:hypothetical protein
VPPHKRIHVQSHFACIERLSSHTEKLSRETG